MTAVDDVMLYAVAQEGDRYQFGAEADFNDPDPSVFDCSELVEWSCARAGVRPRVPDGSWLQARHCRDQGTLVEVTDAVRTRGALLFRFSADPFTAAVRPEQAHVAWSLGDGTTVEAKGTKWGVGSWTADPAKRHWTHAGLIPGVEYPAGATLQSVDGNDGAPAVDGEEEDDMTRIVFYKGPAGDVHPYAVTGAVGKHLSPAGLNLHVFFKTPTVSSATEGLGEEWQDGVALLDGPLRNIS